MMAEPVIMNGMIFGQDPKTKFRRPSKACLLCYREYSGDIFKTKRDSMESLDFENNQNAFIIFCKILEVDPKTYSRTWDFSNEAMPFCASCTSLACRLSNLYDELGVIQQEIILNTEMIKGTMLQSQDRSARRVCSDRRVDTFRQEVIFSLMRGLSSSTEALKYAEKERTMEQIHCDAQFDPYLPPGFQQIPSSGNEFRNAHNAKASRMLLIPASEVPSSPDCCNEEFYKDSHAFPLEHTMKKEKFDEVEESYEQSKPIVGSKRRSVFRKNDLEVFEIEDEKRKSFTSDDENEYLNKQFSQAAIAEYGKLLESQLRIQESYNQHFEQGPQFPLSLVKKSRGGFNSTFQPSPPFENLQNLQESQLPCEEMSTDFETSRSPLYHGSSSPDSQRMTPPDSPNANTPGMHNCHECGKQYSKPYQLKAHLRLHTGEKPYRCNICAKTFRLAGNLRVHTRIHTGETPYECQFCGKRCTQKSQLNTHVLIHHKKSEQMKD